MSATIENNMEVGMIEDTLLPSENQMEIDNCEVQIENKKRWKTDPERIEDTNTFSAPGETKILSEKSGQSALTPKTEKSVDDIIGTQQQRINSHTNNQLTGINIEVISCKQCIRENFGNKLENEDQTTREAKPILEEVHLFNNDKTQSGMSILNIATSMEIGRSGSLIEYQMHSHNNPYTVLDVETIVQLDNSNITQQNANDNRDIIQSESFNSGKETVELIKDEKMETESNGTTEDDETAETQANKQMSYSEAVGQRRETRKEPEYSVDYRWAVKVKNGLMNLLKQERLLFDYEL
ncbi:hypothetical protein C2G38_2204246 [Gigaspora rosea]|uniref:Uncharacterized protein n=1 Tax=Gigaspora rosea TaxID=44941 RepID=A0A397UUC8_9GLOM|nr:hypothetical protein C2G38_2204246 [Gigaspora rosea]CAG8758181.1 176_t:CDS:2 [Gigaspora rosea]